MNLQRIVIIGSGNLAEALARAVARTEGLRLVQLFARNPQRGPEVARLGRTEWVSAPERLAEADLYLLAVSDRAVSGLAAELPIPDGAVVAHTAGSVALDALPARLSRRAVLYPLQTFTRGRDADFRRIPLFLEASDETVYGALERFALRLSGTVRRADSAQRARIHLAGVFACNFANRMYALGGGLLDEMDLGFDLLKPIIAETAAKACDAAAPADVQTGPAVRHDRATLERHAELLARNPQLQEIYSTISQNIWETSRKI